MTAKKATSGYQSSRSIGSALAHEFTLVSEFPHGYRHREDQTVLPPGVLVDGSQNVLTNTAKRVAIRKGYTLDGQADTGIAPIQSAFDWPRHTGDTQHLRSGFNTTGSNGKLQFRYVATAAGQSWNGNVFVNEQVYWIDLMTGLTNSSFNFTDFWDFNTELKALLLFVNGTPNIFEWSGGVTTLASATINTLTKQGVKTWAEEGFLTAGTRSVTINGSVFTYSGGEGTTTLTGVAPDPTIAAYSVGTVMFQTVRQNSNGVIAGLPAAFKNTYIANLKNQIYIGAPDNNSVYVSKVNNFKDYTFTVPVRKVGEGAILTLDGVPTAFIPQETQMYISAGMDQWYQTSFVLSADLTNEQLVVARLKTTGLQAAQSQALVTKIKNNVAFVSFEPIVNTLGLVQDVLNFPQATDLSYPIVDDVNNYNFGDGVCIYHKMFLYVSIPKSSTVRIYNMTNPQNPYWEAPQILPIARFSIIDGELYGHSYQVGETYKLFTGYNDNGAAINAIAKFSFNGNGIRSASKSFNEFFVDGYISSNTTLSLGIQYDLDGCSTIVSYPILGTDSRIVCLKNSGNDNSLGKNPLGKHPLGGSNKFTTGELPPYFHVIKTFPRVPYYYEQTTFSSLGIDEQWEIISFGGVVAPTSENNASITE